MEQGIELSERHNCYICFEPSSGVQPFINTGCSCRGALKIHELCFKKLGKSSCSICKKEYCAKALRTLLKKHIEFYDNGKKSLEVDVINDPETGEEIYHGEAKHYLETGRLWLWCNYTNGEPSKFYRIYNVKGEVEIEKWYS
jgi:hypothetical protein